MAGTSWSGVEPSGLSGDLYDIHFVDANKGITVGAGGNVRTTTDGGTSWSSVDCDTDKLLAGVFLFSDASSGIIVGDDGVIKVHSTSSGCSTPTSGVTADLTDVHCVSTTACWVVGKGSTILATTDGGDSWSTQNAPAGASADLADVFMVSVTAGYAVGSGGAVWKYNSGTWTALTCSGCGTTNLNGVFFDGSTGYVVGNAKLLQKTINGGTTWSSKAGSSPDTNHNFLGIMCASVTKCFVVSADQGSFGNRYVLRTNDEGVNWETYTEWEGSWNAVSGYWQ